MTLTTQFWRAAALLRFAVLKWAVGELGLSLGHAAGLQAASAVGIVVGAVLASQCVPLDRAARVLPLGVLKGLLVPLAGGGVNQWAVAVPLLLGVGALGGALVVPLSALLQRRGHTLLSAGRSIDVQNGNENLSVPVMLGVYAALLGLQVDVRVIMAGLGLFVAGCVALLQARRVPQTRMC